MARARFSTIDRLKLATSTTVSVSDAETNANIQAFADALDGILLGADTRAVKTVDTIVDIGAATPPSDDTANRGMKWQFECQDSVNGKLFQYEIGTADFTALPTPTSDFLDLTVGVGLAMKNAWDTIVLSPFGNSTTLLSVQQVTRTD